MYQLDIANLRKIHGPGPQRLALRVPPTVLLLGAVSCLTDVSSEMVSSVLPIYALVYLALSPAQFGLLDGLYQGVSAIAHLASGILADRWQRHKALASVGYGLSAVSKLGLLAGAAAPGALATVVSFDRTGKGVRTAPRDALISLSAREGDLGLAFGVHRALDTAGVVIGPLLVYAILGAWMNGFETVFAVSFAMAAMGLAVLLFGIDESSAPMSRRAPSVREMWQIVADARFRTIWIVAVALGATVMSDGIFYVILQRRAGVAVEIVPLIYVGTALAYLTLAIPVGQIADRVGRAPVYVLGHALVIALYGLTLTGTLHPAALLIVVVLYGVYYASSDGVVAALASRVLPRDVRASGLGAINTGTSLAKLAGSVTFGAIWTWRGPSIALTAALAGTALTIAAAAPSLLRLDRQPQEPPLA